MISYSFDSKPKIFRNFTKFFRNFNKIFRNFNKIFRNFPKFFEIFQIFSKFNKIFLIVGWFQYIFFLFFSVFYLLLESQPGGIDSLELIPIGSLNVGMFTNSGSVLSTYYRRGRKIEIFFSRARCLFYNKSSCSILRPALGELFQEPRFLYIQDQLGSNSIRWTRAKVEDRGGHCLFFMCYSGAHLVSGANSSGRRTRVRAQDGIFQGLCLFYMCYSRAHLVSEQFGPTDKGENGGAVCSRAIAYSTFIIPGPTW